MTIGRSHNSLAKKTGATVLLWPSRLTYRHRASALSTILALGAGTLLVFAAPALAHKTHGFIGSFGASSSSPGNPYPLSDPADVAVDNSTGPSQHDIYVSDPANHRVEKFSPTGEFILMFGKDVDKTTGANVCTAVSGDTCQAGTQGGRPGEFESPTFVAVDNSSGTSAGNVYVGDTNDGTVSKFTETGNLIESWGAGGQLSGFGGLNGIAVDHHGNLFVLTESDYWYNESGVFHSEFGHPRGTSSAGLAVDSEDNLYKADGSPEITKFTDTGENLGEPDGEGNASGLTIDPATNDLYVVQGGYFVRQFALNCGQDCTSLDSFGNGYLHGAQGISVDGSTGVVYVANTGSGEVAVFKEGIEPNVATGPPTSQGQTSVTLNGEIEPAGGGEVTTCKFEYGTNTEYNLGSAPCEPATPYSGNQTVTAKVAGLPGEVELHYRLVASNADGLLSAGEDYTFTLHYVPGLTTEPATGVSRICATFTGSFEGNGEDTKYDFEYVTQEQFNSTGFSGASTTSEEDAGSPSSHEALSYKQCGLRIHTTYYYRVTASNSVGTSTGHSEEFTTQPAVEDLETEPATKLTGTSAMLNGSLQGNGEETEYYFEWGPSPAYGTVTPIRPTSLGSPVGHTIAPPVEIANLEPATTYYYRIVASNSVGITMGPERSLETLTLPRITARPANEYSVAKSETETTDVTVHARVDPVNGGEVTSCMFEYGPEEGKYTDGSRSCEPGHFSGASEVSNKLTNLSIATTYHFRFTVTTVAGTTVGPDQTVTTLPLLPEVESISANGVQEHSATLGAVINPGYGLTIYRFQYGPTTSYGEQTPPEAVMGTENSDQSVGTEITDLEPGTAYHFRVIATNFAGTRIGPDHTFTTPDLPKVGEADASEIASSGATLTAEVDPELSPTTYHFEFGTTSRYGASTVESASVGEDAVDHVVSARLSGLEPDTTYHFRIVATNGNGVAQGFDQTLTTLPASEEVLTQEEGPPKVKCRKLFVLKHGKCVKKKTPKHHRSTRSRRL